MLGGNGDSEEQLVCDEMRRQHAGGAADAFLKICEICKQTELIRLSCMAAVRRFRRRLAKLGIETGFVNGLRITNEAVLDVVEMVLAGQINKEIVRRIQKTGAKALGLSGVDGI